jgi:hypothetical protein
LGSALRDHTACCGARLRCWPNGGGAFNLDMKSSGSASDLADMRLTRLDAVKETQKLFWEA